MTDTQTYKGIYKDNFGTREIIIENDFKTLSLEIDQVKFSGSEFAALSIIDESKYSAKQLERFTLLSTPIYKTDIVEKTLCNCSFEVTVPQLIIDKLTDSEFYWGLKIQYSLGNVRREPSGGLEFEKVKLALTIDGKTYTGTSDLSEIAFDQIRTQFDDKYQFKNCYGCMYGDYSVYGQSSFGTMLCFVSQKDRYAQVTSKSEYMELTNDCSQVQEIYCCGKYEIRKKGVGYRG